MPETVEHTSPSNTLSPSLTARFEHNPDGWVTAQFIEVPQAISQGRDENEAYRNLLGAMYDLTHETTPAERIATTLQARVLEPLLSLLHH